MKRHYLLPMLAAMLLFCARPSTDASAQSSSSRFEPSECLVPVPQGRTLECGYLVTPENAKDPGSQSIRLPVIILRSSGTNRSTEALLFTEGGPGGSSLGSVGWLSSLDYLDENDIVILQQRGNLYAKPALDCPLSAIWEGTSENTPCLRSIQQAGIDLTNYTTAAIAGDIHTLMQVLGYQGWNLYGTSYSTRLMQLVMQRYPDKIRSVVLHSTLPLTDTRYRHDPEHAARALQVMLQDCASDPACAAAYPDLENQLYALIRRLNKEPVTFQMKTSQADETFSYQVDGSVLIGWMVTKAFYRPAFPPYDTAYLPLLIQWASTRHSSVLYPWAYEHIAHWDQEEVAWGLYFAVHCQDDAPTVTAAQMEQQAAAYPELDGYLRTRDELATCALWNLPPAERPVPEPVRSDLPTLVLSGRYDPITPPEWSRTALVNLSQSTFVEFPSAGHSVPTSNPCALQIVSSFLKNPGQQPDLSCMADAPQVRFVLPDEIIFAPAMYEIHYGELGYTRIEEYIFLGCLLALMLEFALSLLIGIVALFQRRDQASSHFLSRVAFPLAGLLTLLAIVWSYTLRFALQITAAEMPVVLRFGLPSAWWPLFAAALLMAISTAFLIALAVMGWVRLYWSFFGRVFISIVAITTGIFIAMLAYWGVLTALLA